MDPEACLGAAEDFASTNEWGEVAFLLAELSVWLRAGGFKPYRMSERLSALYAAHSFIEV